MLSTLLTCTRLQCTWCSVLKSFQNPSSLQSSLAGRLCALLYWIKIHLRVARSLQTAAISFLLPSVSQMHLFSCTQLSLKESWLSILSQYLSQYTVNTIPLKNVLFILILFCWKSTQLMRQARILQQILKQCLTYLPRFPEVETKNPSWSFFRLF